MNITVLRGTLRGAARITELPGGSRVHNFELQAEEGDDRHVVPVAWHDPSRPLGLAEGDAVVVIGAVRRRWFRAGGASQSRTEVLASAVGRVGTPRATRALESAAAAIAASGSFG